MSSVSVGRTLKGAAKFTFRSPGKLWPRIALPMLAGAACLYLSTSLYFTEFERYLRSPNDRLAGLVLGQAMAGLLLTLFMHSAATATTTRLALGHVARGWHYFSTSRAVWRIFAAYMRFLAICVFYVVSVEASGALAAWLLPGMLIDPIVEFVTFGGLAFLLVRVGFLIAPVAADTDIGPIVRRSLRLSAGHFWPLAGVMAAVLGFGAAVEMGCEYIVRTAMFVPQAANVSLPDFVESYRRLLPAIIGAVGVGYVCSIVLLAAAGAMAYRQITSPK